MDGVGLRPGGLSVDGSIVLDPLLDQLQMVPESEVKAFLAERARSWELAIPFPREVIDAAAAGGLDISPTASPDSFVTT